jgi:hypothetical protein
LRQNSLSDGARNLLHNAVYILVNIVHGKGTDPAQRGVPRRCSRAVRVLSALYVKITQETNVLGLNFHPKMTIQYPNPRPPEKSN